MSKKTIIGIIVFMLFIPSFIVSAEQMDTKKSPIILNDDVPIWNKGDSWTFTVSDFWVNFTYEGKNIQMIGKIDDFTWTVKEDSGSNYEVEVKGEITANYEISLPVGSLFLKISGTLNPTGSQLKGTIIFGKSNLELIDFSAEIKGLTSIKIHPIPINIPLPVKITADTDISTPFPLFNFPLHILKIWNLPEIDIIANLNLGGIFGLIKIPMPIYVHYDWTPLAFTCLYQESVTVEAGTYDAWLIKSLLGGFFEYYYAPSVGNIIKIDVNMPRGGIEAELKSTNYA